MAGNFLIRKAWLKHGQVHLKAAQHMPLFRSAKIALSTLEAASSRLQGGFEPMHALIAVSGYFFQGEGKRI